MEDIINMGGTAEADISFCPWQGGDKGFFSFIKICLEIKTLLGVQMPVMEFFLF